MGLLAQQRAIEFVEATGLLRVSVQVVLNAGLSFARPWSGCRGRVQAAVCRSMGPLAACAFQGTRWVTITCSQRSSAAARAA